jgi:hypothetical protein
MDNPIKEFEHLDPKKKALVLGGAAGIALLLYLHSRSTTSSSASTSSTGTDNTATGTADSGSTDSDDATDGDLDYGDDPTGGDPWNGGSGDSGDGGDGSTSGSTDDPDLDAAIAGLGSALGAGDLGSGTASDTDGPSVTGGGAPKTDADKHKASRIPTRDSVAKNKRKQAARHRTGKAGKATVKATAGKSPTTKAPAHKRSQTPKKTTKHRR